MARKVMSLFAAFICGAIGFFASVEFFKGIGYGFLAMFIGVGGPNIMSQPAFMISIHVIVAVIFFIAVFQIAMNRYFIPLMKALPFIYIFVAFCSIMLKSRGVRGVNLNPLGIVAEFFESPATIFFNMLVLVPLGALFRVKGVTAKKSFIAALAIVLCCEISQFVFSLGICDVVDMILNVFGFAFGYCLADFVVSSGIKFVKSSRNFYCVRRASPGDSN